MQNALADLENPMADAITDMLGAGKMSSRQRSLIEMLMAQQAQAGAVEEPDVTILDPADQTNDEADRLLDAAERRISDLEDILASLADALGACPGCFGADPGCRACSGQGEPGAYSPDREAFNFFVLPVLNRLKRRRKRGSYPAAETSQTRPDANLERSA